MSRPLRLAASLLHSIATAFAVHAEPRPDGMLPPEVASQFSSAHLEGFGEPALWRAEARRGYRSRIRLTINGILLSKVAIRIDERDDGRLSGHVAFVDSRDRERPRGRSERNFRLTRAQFEALQAAIQRAELWSIYPQFYVLTEEESICIDGMELIFERVDANGYRFANANAQCTAPPAMLQVAAQIIDASGERQVRRWLN